MALSFAAVISLLLFIAVAKPCMVMGTREAKDIVVQQRYTRLVSGVTVTNNCKCPVRYILADCPGWTQSMIPQLENVVVFGDGQCVMFANTMLFPQRPFFFFVGLDKPNKLITPISVGVHDSC